MVIKPQMAYLKALVILICLLPSMAQSLPGVSPISLVTGHQFLLALDL